MNNNNGVGDDVQLLHNNASWCYLFIRRAHFRYIIGKLESKFEVFIHKTRVHVKGKSKVAEKLRPTISGLVFVHGNSNAVQNYLNENFQGLYLVKDCSTGKPAVIRNSVMSSFMQLSQVSPNRLRFMPHTFNYYSEGHTLVRIVSGPLSGLEGYIVRISRDKCLVTSMGGMTVAIGGVCKESFENAEDYISQRRGSSSESREQVSEMLEEFSLSELDKCFFTIQNELDVLAVAKILDRWMLKAEYLVIANDYRNAVSILLKLIYNTGISLKDISILHPEVKITPLKEICSEAFRIIDSCYNNEIVHISLKECIFAEKQKLEKLFPCLL